MPKSKGSTMHAAAAHHANDALTQEDVVLAPTDEGCFVP